MWGPDHQYPSPSPAHSRSTAATRPSTLRHQHWSCGAYLRNTFRERLFRINDISHENNPWWPPQTSFVGDRACPVPDFNVSASLALFPFNISVANKRLVFFHNCTVPREFSLPRCANH
ncbi:hypothetical protein ZWY2020_035818 [Hordeum vulgare]|nr:hypothetical protein ZWY2020_035818 [Hordeum vulgare]